MILSCVDSLLIRFFINRRYWFACSIPLTLIARAGDADRLAFLGAQVALEDVFIAQAAFGLVEGPLDRRELEVGFCLHFKNRIIRLIINPLKDFICGGDRYLRIPAIRPSYKLGDAPPRFPGR